MKRIYFIGMDPGTKGAISIVAEDGRLLRSIRFSRHSEHETVDELRPFVQSGQAFAVLERVGAMPKQGVSSTFKFGRSAGFLLGVLVSLRIPFDLVGPRIWQLPFITTKKNEPKTAHKNRLKARAHELFPGHVKTIVHENADSILLAEYARRFCRGEV